MIETKSETSGYSYLEKHSDGYLHYSQGWFDLLAKLYKYTVITLTTKNSAGEITGTLPLCYMQSPLTGRRLVSLPFTDHAPLIAEDEDSANDLINQAISLAQKKNVKYLELRTGINEVMAKRSDFVSGDLYVRWLMQLNPNPDVVWAALRKPVQRQIKKSQGQGVQVRIADKREDMALYHHLHVLTRMKHGMPAQPKNYFYELWDLFAASGNVQLLLAEHEGKTIAGMIVLASGTTARYAYGASDEAFLNLAPNNLLLWTAITWACKNGYVTLDLGRTARDNKGLMDYKQRWGAIEEPMPYYYYPKMTGLSSTSESSGKFQLMTTIWKKLPIQVAGPLGGYLYKHLG